MKQKFEKLNQEDSMSKMPRNVWAVSATSFFMDISSEMVINILPLFLANVLGVRTNIIGVIEGVAESTASLLKLFSGWLSDRLRGRKWIAVTGYAISALSKPFFYFASSWGIVASVRWADRIGKGIRTSPRDALVADSVAKEIRGKAFGISRAADTAGAMVGLLVAMGVIWLIQQNASLLGLSTFKTIVLISIIPAIMAVLTLTIGAKDVPVSGANLKPIISFHDLGRNFSIFMFIVAIFDLGNSSDAFLILRAQERGLSAFGILAMLAAFNFIYAFISIPAGSLSDKIGRRKIIIGGWLVYALIYLGFGFAQVAWHVIGLYILYGFYYGLAFGTTKAMIADLVPDTLRGTAYGTYNAVLGILDLPASIIAGVLWQGVGSWLGFGPSAPFLFGGVMALIASFFMLIWRPKILQSQ